MNPQALIAEITAAFHEEPYPGDENIVYDNTGTHSECEEIREAFKGHRWQQVPDEVLSMENTGLSCMSEQGFKYYLPAFMCALLRDRTIVGGGIDMVILMLKLPTEIDIAVVAEQLQRYAVPSKVPTALLNDVLQNQLAQTNDSINEFVTRASQFTQAQGRAICHFLTYIRDKFNEEDDAFLNSEAGLAIRRYWFQFSPPPTK